VSGGCPEFPDNHTFVQFALMEDIANMLGDGLLAFAKQLRHVLLRQPDCFLLQPDIDFDFSVRVPVDENFGVIHHCILLKIDLRHRDLAVHQHKHIWGHNTYLA
jgi:hypothetical protein